MVKLGREAKQPARRINSGDLLQRVDDSEQQAFLVIGVSYAFGEPKVQLCDVPKKNPKRQGQPGPWRGRKASLFKVVGADLGLLSVYEVMKC